MILNCGWLKSTYVIAQQHLQKFSFDCQFRRAVAAQSRITKT